MLTCKFLALHSTYYPWDANVITSNAFMVFLHNILTQLEHQHLSRLGRIHPELVKEDFTLDILLFVTLLVLRRLKYFSGCWDPFPSVCRWGLLVVPL